MLSLIKFEQISLIMQQRISKTRKHAIGKIDSSWLKQGDGQD